MLATGNITCLLHVAKVVAPLRRNKQITIGSKGKQRRWPEEKKRRGWDHNRSVFPLEGYPMNNIIYAKKILYFVIYED